MPPTAKLDFPKGKPTLYAVAGRLVALMVAANVVLCYWIPKYSSSLGDQGHPIAIRFNGVVLHLSTVSGWLLRCSFVGLFVTILLIVGLSFYYVATGVALPRRRQIDTQIVRDIPKR
jgi:hypothetical protein